MRYHHEKPKLYISVYGMTHECNHPVYEQCTLYLESDIGLAVIQQRFNPTTKSTWWSEIDPWLTDELYLHPRFSTYFNERARKGTEDIFPTVTIRQIMWSLKMKPLPRERWESVFDRRYI